MSGETEITVSQQTKKVSPADREVSVRGDREVSQADREGESGRQRGKYMYIHVSGRQIER